MTAGMAWRPVSNIVIIKNKVTNGVTWLPVSQGGSPKGVFHCSKSAKITKKFFFFWGGGGGGKKNSFDLVVWVNEVIKTISNLFILFFTKRFHRHKNRKRGQKAQKAPNTSKRFSFPKSCCLCCFLFASFCFVSLFFVSVLLACFCL